MVTVLVSNGYGVGWAQHQQRARHACIEMVMVVVMLVMMEVMLLIIPRAC
jgi:hypothetical protein